MWETFHFSLYCVTSVCRSAYIICLVAAFPNPYNKDPAVNKKDNPAEQPFLTNLPRAIAYIGFS